MRLDAENLSIRRGESLALSGLSLTLLPGARACVVGPAGSGKTTLLKALAGLLPATGGVIRWDGQDVQGLPSSERRALQAQLGMVFQGDALFDSSAVLANVMLPLLKRGVAASEARERARRALAEVSLEQAAEALPEALSGGMRKRVGIARAVVARPAVLFADDPFAGLDPQTALEVGRVLERVSDQRTLVLAAPEVPPWLPLPQRITLAIPAGEAAGVPA